jgi:hypothetical protein
MRGNPRGLPCLCSIEIDRFLIAGFRKRSIIEKGKPGFLVPHKNED